MTCFHTWSPLRFMMPWLNPGSGCDVVRDPKEACEGTFCSCAPRRSELWRAPSADDEPILLPPGNVHFDESSILQELTVLIDSRMPVNHVVPKKDVAARHQARTNGFEHLKIAFADLCRPCAGTFQRGSKSEP